MNGWRVDTYLYFDNSVQEICGVVGDITTTWDKDCRVMQITILVQREREIQSKPGSIKGVW